MPMPRELSLVVAVREIRVVQGWLRLIGHRTGTQKHADNAVVKLDSIASLMHELRLAEQEIKYLRRQLRKVHLSSRDTG